MTIKELSDFLKEFMEKYPECKDKSIMVKSLKDDSTWEEVKFVTGTVVMSSPKYGSPIYLHSESEQEVTKKRNEKMKDSEDYYEFFL